MPILRRSMRTTWSSLCAVTTAASRSLSTWRRRFRTIRAWRRPSSSSCTIPHGQSDALVYLYDLFPTICDMAGAEPPAVVEGRSLLPVVVGKQARVRDRLFGAYRNCQRMVRDEQWKLIEYNAGGTRNTQLFDLRNDPDELHNLAADLEHAGQLKRLRTLLVEAQKEFDDPYPSFLEPVAPDKANAGPSTPAKGTAARSRAKKVKGS
jgi:hypothetical protein